MNVKMGSVLLLGIFNTFYNSGDFANQGNFILDVPTHFYTHVALYDLLCVSGHAGYTAKDRWGRLGGII